jgi:hypothetical protein
MTMGGEKKFFLASGGFTEKMQQKLDGSLVLMVRGQNELGKIYDIESNFLS